MSCHLFLLICFMVHFLVDYIEHENNTISERTLVSQSKIDEIL